MRNKTLDNRISKLEVIGRHEPLSTSMTSMIEDATVQWGAQPDDLHSALSQMEMKVTVAGLPYFSAENNKKIAPPKNDLWSNHSIEISQFPSALMSSK